MLLDRIDARSGDEIIAMDISLERNHSRASELIRTGVAVTWIDHHLAGEDIAGLVNHIDTSSDVCTAIIVNRILGGKFQSWAITAAYGDGMTAAADMLGGGHRPDLAEMGELLNYNAYGPSIEDLHFHPQVLLEACIDAGEPRQFIKTDIFHRLRDGFIDDLQLARDLHVRERNLIQLPAESWAHRVVGVYAHRIAGEEPELPHVIAVDLGNGTWQVSLRAPKNNPSGAGEVCASFGGGGRASAGGVDALPGECIPALMKSVDSRWTD
jgi:hypothetical protein